MPTYKQDVSFGTPTDYTLEAQKIARQRKMAEALQAQAAQPMGGTEMVGGWAIPKSPWEGIGKASQDVSAEYQMRQLDEREKKLAEGLRTQGANDMRDIYGAIKGRAAEARQGPLNDDEGNPMPGVAAQLPDRERAMEIASRSQNPMVQHLGAALMADMVKTPEGAFAKVKPADYTDASIREFMASGGKDFSLLKPRVKQEAVNAGNETRFVDPYAPGPAIQHGAAPRVEMVNQGNQVTPLIVGQNGVSQPGGSLPVNISPYQNAELGIQRTNAANTGINTQFNTGSGAMPPAAPPIPQVGAQVPPNMQQPPRAAPQGIPSVPRQAVAPAQAAQPNDGLTPAGRAGVAKDIATKRAEASLTLPQDLQTMQNALDTVDKLVGNKEKGIPEHPGFQSLVGVGVPGLRFLPGTETKGADKLLDQIGGQTFLQAYQSLRGGGQITEVEGAKATAALQRMDRSQSESEFRQAAEDFRTNLIKGMELARGKAGVSPQRRSTDYTGPRTNYLPQQSSTPRDVRSEADKILGL